MEVPDGYERWPDPERGPGLRLLDPTDCPAGHLFRFGQRGSLAYCEVHEPHNTWICACGQMIYRVEGAFVSSRVACAAAGS